MWPHPLNSPTVGGGVAERWRDDKGEGGGVSIPPKSDDVIYEQPLYTYSSRVHMYIYIYIFILALMFDLM